MMQFHIPWFKGNWILFQIRFLDKHFELPEYLRYRKCKKEGVKFEPYNGH